MKISVLGTGCPKCKKLGETAEAAALELGVEYELEKVTDISAIMKFGVMLTPALAIDGKVVAAGKVMSLEATKALLSEQGSGDCGCSGGGCGCS
jgi:small redox-active disulfide protein 2